MAANGNKNETSAGMNGAENGDSNSKKNPMDNDEQSSIDGGLASQQGKDDKSNDNSNNKNTSNGNNKTETENGTTSGDNNGTANSHHYNQESTNYNNGSTNEEKKTDNSNANGGSSSSSAASNLPSRFKSKRSPSSQLMQSNNDFEQRQQDKVNKTQQALAQQMYEKKNEEENGKNENDGKPPSEEKSQGPSQPISQHPDIDRVISKLMTMTMRRSRKSKYITATQTDPKNMLTEKELESVCQQSRKIFMSQPMLIEIDAPIKIVGDIHGQYFDLLRLFELGGMPPDANYVFLGDYVDRGRNSLEVISLLLSFKIKYPKNFFLLRGNHECASINRIYGFFDECKRRYKSGVQLWKKFCDVFNCLPVAAVIDDKIFCMHGGLSPDLRNFDQIRKIRRPTDVPDSGLLCDLLWADPDKEQIGWGENDRYLFYLFIYHVLLVFGGFTKTKKKKQNSKKTKKNQKFTELKYLFAWHWYDLSWFVCCLID